MAVRPRNPATTVEDGRLNRAIMDTMHDVALSAENAILLRDSLDASARRGNLGDDDFSILADDGTNSETETSDEVPRL
ncbi:hypothetical protein M501DRAFT_996524 [Patellaria atrata CBS 101060]|uniref:Uncharacterized protein n=1 Tax=Patellaria atrata CBS 101060 TaxID=1346257 RepID=A0A9P4S6X0_9PEZI|nr:hypothetical protein M501DRAFT_996524 [Patellaria atrata CBS 101060]